MTTTVDGKMAEELLVVEFPKRILKINKLLAKPEFSTAALEPSNFKLDIPMNLILQQNAMYIEMKKKHCDHSINGTEKVGTITNGNLEIIPANKKIVEMTKIVKPNLIQLVEDITILKMWVSLLIPKIEDGDSFGVSIQEEIIQYIQSVEEHCNLHYISFSDYNRSRADLLTKVVKYPYLEDYRLAIEDLDEHHYASLILAMYGFHNHYLKLQDIFIKNIDRIKMSIS